MPHFNATPALVAGAYIFLFALERFVPLRGPGRRLLRRLTVNAAVAGLAIVTAAVTVRPVASYVLGLGAQAHWGIVRAAAIPAGLRFCIAFLLMDLSFYYWHLANHRLPFLWRFHNVHHIDPELDVTTALRFHFGEVALSSLFRAVQISIIGLSAGTFLVYEAVFHANTAFQHSNIRLPLRLERLLNKLIVTPRMHGIHHSQVYNEANSNYSVVFSWWDRLHGTLRLNVPQAQLRIGMAAYAEPVDNTVRRALSLPFRRQRDYWRAPGGRPLQRQETLDPGPVTHMAE